MTTPNQRDPDLFQILGTLRDGLDDLKKTVISRWGRIPHVTADPVSPPDGAVWMRFDLTQLRHRINGVTYPTDWTNVTFQNSWVGFAGIGVQYRKIGDIVYIRGAADGTAGALGTAVFTLPAGFRPTTQLDYAQVMGASTIGWSTVFTSGAVTANFGNKQFCAMNMIFSITA